MSNWFLIDRLETLELFRRMMEVRSDKRVLRLTGETKMGKSRLLREFKQIAATEFHAHPVLVDLRSKLRSYDDLLFELVGQIGIAYFPNYAKVQEDFSKQPKIELSRIQQLFSSITIKGIGDRVDFQMKRLLMAFIQDLRSLPPNSFILIMLDTVEEASPDLQDWINEHLISEFSHIANLRVVLAGRQLPTPLTSLEDCCITSHLEAVSIEEHRLYCSQMGMQIDEPILKAFHQVFGGTPGLFVEFASKLEVKVDEH